MTLLTFWLKLIDKSKATVLLYYGSKKDVWKVVRANTQAFVFTNLS